MKEEALKLAVWLENMSKLGWADNFGQELDEASAMIRRLVEELDKQEKSDANLHLTPLPEADRSPLDSNESISQHKAIMRKNAFNEYIPLFLGNDGLPEGTLLYTTPQTNPLSDDEIVSIWEKANYESQYYEASDNFAIEFARAIEERHGIK